MQTDFFNITVMNISRRLKVGFFISIPVINVLNTKCAYR
jgi:hypothetical protein